MLTVRGQGARIIMPNYIIKVEENYEMSSEITGKIKVEKRGNNEKGKVQKKTSGKRGKKNTDKGKEVFL